MAVRHCLPLFIVVFNAISLTTLSACVQDGPAQKGGRTNKGTVRPCVMLLI